MFKASKWTRNWGPSDCGPGSPTNKVHELALRNEWNVGVRCEHGSELIRTTPYTQEERIISTLTIML